MMMMMVRRVTCLGTFSQTSLGTWLQTLRGTSVQTSKMEIDFVKHWIRSVSRKYWKNTISPPWPPASAHSRRLLAKPEFTKKVNKIQQKKFYQKLNTRYGSSYIPPWFLFDFVFSSYHWKWKRHDWFGDGDLDADLRKASYIGSGWYLVGSLWYLILCRAIFGVLILSYQVSNL